MNAVEIEQALTNLAASDFNSAKFPFLLLESIGAKATTINRLRKGTTNKSDIENGVLQRNNIHLAVCAAGQVNATLKALRDSPQTSKAKAKIILATDGVELHLEDMNTGEPVVSEYSDLA